MCCINCHPARVGFVVLCHFCAFVLCQVNVFLNDCVICVRRIFEFLSNFALDLLIVACSLNKLATLVGASSGLGLAKNSAKLEYALLSSTYVILVRFTF